MLRFYRASGHAIAGFFLFILPPTGALLLGQQTGTATSETEATEAPKPPPDEVVRLDTFTVQEELAANSQEELRQKAAVSVDMLSSTDFGKYIATDVADIIVRLPGLSTTTRGTFAVVRGLSERYNPVMLDGIGIPSSDPERQSPELDLFPTRLVDTIVIGKTFEPRLPGTSSGATIDLLTKPIPEGRFAQLQFGVRADEGFLKNDPFLGSKRDGFWDYLALGVKDRKAEAPPAIPANAALDYVRSPNTVSSVREESFPIGTRFSVTYEDRIILNEESERAFGYSFSLSYDSTAGTEEGYKFSVDNIFQPTVGAVNGNIDTGIFGFNREDYLESEVETRIGLLATLGYAFNDRHQLAFSFFLSQVGIDTHARYTNGTSIPNLTFAEYTRFRAGNPDPTDSEPEFGERTNEAMEIYYRQRRLANLRLGGDHAFTDNEAIKVSWDLARVDAQQEEPEYLNFPYLYNPEATFVYDAPLGGAMDRYTRYWRDTKERSTIGRVDSEFEFDLGPLSGNSVRAGVYVDRTDRDYLEEALFLNGGSLRGRTLEEFLGALQTYTGRADRFSGSNVQPFANAERKLNAAYVSWLLPILSERPGVHKLDLLAGARMEDFRLVSLGSGRIGNESSYRFYQYLRQKLQMPMVPGETINTVYRGEIDERKVLPVVGLNYSPIKALNFRLSASKTTARPSFREVGSYFTVDRVNDEYVHGNLMLETSDVKNYDVRVEYFFPGSQDLVAFSVFRKDIAKPIERLSLDITNVGAVSTFVNNPSDAVLNGFEFEGAKKLDFLGEWGSWFTLGGNYTFIDASVAREPLLEAVQIESTGISDTRQLYDQPEWIANAYVTFEHPSAGFSTTLSWFGISDVLQKVNEYTWDTYTASHSRFDVTMSQRLGNRWQIRLSARNLFDPDRKTIADPHNTNQEIVYRRYSDGRSYTLTASYEF
ncbi:MAG: TonB-dependent receptor [Opitutaceae bacterium]|nr:TonB-dependent receptor [Opitutaceae bacterium]